MAKKPKPRTPEPIIPPAKGMPLNEALSRALNTPPPGSHEDSTGRGKKRDRPNSGKKKE